MKELQKLKLPEYATKIKAKCREINDAARTTLERVREGGQLLIDAKEAVYQELGYGHWGAWLAEHCDLAERTARAYVAIANQWDELVAKVEAKPCADGSLRQRVAEVPMRKALKLLAHSANPEDVLTFTCPTCGEKFDREVWHCPGCNAHLSPDVTACGECDLARPSPAAATPSTAGQPGHKSRFPNPRYRGPVTFREVPFDEMTVEDRRELATNYSDIHDGLTYCLDGLGWEPERIAEYMGMDVGPVAGILDPQPPIRFTEADADLFPESYTAERRDCFRRLWRDGVDFLVAKFQWHGLFVAAGFAFYAGRPDLCVRLEALATDMGRKVERLEKRVLSHKADPEIFMYCFLSEALAATGMEEPKATVRELMREAVETMSVPDDDPPEGLPCPAA